MSTAPDVLSIKRTRGIAGEYSLTASIQYPGESPEHVTFTSSTYGPPVVMSTEGIPGGVFVSQRVLERIGSTLDEAWVRAFFAPRD